MSKFFIPSLCFLSLAATISFNDVAAMEQVPDSNRETTKQKLDSIREESSEIDDTSDSEENGFNDEIYKAFKEKNVIIVKKHESRENAGTEQVPDFKFYYSEVGRRLMIESPQTSQEIMECLPKIKCESVINLKVDKASLLNVAEIFKIASLFPNLERINIYGLPDSYIDFSLIEVSEKLTLLGISMNKNLQSINFGNVFPAVEYLFIHGNRKLKSVNGIENMPNLSVLDLSYNGLDDFTTDLTNLSELKNVDLSFNPLSNDAEKLPGIRALFSQNIPNDNVILSRDIFGWIRDTSAWMK